MAKRDVDRDRDRDQDAEAGEPATGETAAGEATTAEEPVDAGETPEGEGSLFRRMKGKARGMQTSVAEKARGMQTSVAEKAKGMQDSVAEKIAETSEAAQDKFRDKLNELNSILPCIRELGYSVDAIHVGLGLLPDVSIEVSGLAKTMDNETYERVLEAQKDNKLTCLILRALQTTSVWQKKIHFMNMGCDHATVTLGIPPKMTLKFDKTGEPPRPLAALGEGRRQGT